MAGVAEKKVGGLTWAEGSGTCRTSAADQPHVVALGARSAGTAISRYPDPAMVATALAPSLWSRMRPSLEFTNATGSEAGGGAAQP